jgi:uncharacterized membrane protein
MAEEIQNLLLASTLGMLWGWGRMEEGTENTALLARALFLDFSHWIFEYEFV